MIFIHYRILYLFILLLYIYRYSFPFQFHLDLQGQAVEGNTAASKPVLWNCNYLLRFRFRLLTSYVTVLDQKSTVFFKEKIDIFLQIF